MNLHGALNQVARNCRCELLLYLVGHYQRRTAANWIVSFPVDDTSVAERAHVDADGHFLAEFSAAEDCLFVVAEVSCSVRTGGFAAFWRFSI